MQTTEATPASPRILVVEDDAAIRLILRKSLCAAGFLVETCADAAMAIARLDLAPRFDLLISDVNMPGMTGFDLARAVKSKKELKQMPVIFLTARDRSMDVVEGINAGARHYVTKPFRIEDMVERVRKVLRAA